MNKKETPLTKAEIIELIDERIIALVKLIPKQSEEVNRTLEEIQKAKRDINMVGTLIDQIKQRLADAVA